MQVFTESVDIHAICEAVSGEYTVDVDPYMSRKIEVEAPETIRVTTSVPEQVPVKMFATVQCIRAADNGCTIVFIADVQLMDGRAPEAKFPIEVFIYTEHNPAARDIVAKRREEALKRQQEESVRRKNFCTQVHALISTH